MPVRGLFFQKYSCHLGKIWGGGGGGGAVCVCVCVWVSFFLWPLEKQSVVVAAHTKTVCRCGGGKSERAVEPPKGGGGGKKKPVQLLC